MHTEFPLTDEALETAKKSDAVLLGAVGGNVGNSKWYDVAPNLRPEAWGCWQSAKALIYLRIFARLTFTMNWQMPVR